MDLIKKEAKIGISGEDFQAGYVCEAERITWVGLWKEVEIIT